MHAFSSDEAKHPASSAQQGLRVKHVLEALMSDIVKEFICCKSCKFNSRKVPLQEGTSGRLGELHRGQTSHMHSLGLGECVFGTGQAAQLGRGA